MNELQAFTEKLKKQTGAHAFINEENEIVLQPAQLHRPFFSRLLPALIDTDFSFLVNRNLEVVIYKP